MFSMARRRCFGDLRPHRLLFSSAQHGQARWLSDSSLSGLHDKLTSRKLPLVYDYLSPQPSHLLNLTLADFLPKVKLASPHYAITTELPSINGPSRMAVGHHLIYFPPQVRASQLLPDGTDVLHTPGHPFNCRMWAGGRVRFPKEGGLLLNGHRAVCLEGIRDVTIKGREGEEKVFVGIERRVATVAEEGGDENVRRKLWTKDEGDPGDAVVIERRNLVFMRPKSPEQTALNRGSENKNERVVKPPSDPEYSHVILPSRSLLFRFSALTFNAHSIHLDQRYANEIEGYRNLLVHGPLSLTIMLSVLRCHLFKYRQAIRDIEYRNLAPLYVEEEMKSNEVTAYKRGGGLGSSDGSFGNPLQIASAAAPVFGFNTLGKPVEKRESKDSSPKLRKALRELRSIVIEPNNDSTRTENLTFQREPKIDTHGDITESTPREHHQTGQYKMSDAKGDVLDPNFRVTDPHSYFENLNNLRKRVIESSEFFRRQGEFKISRKLPAVYFSNKPSSVSTEVWDRCKGLTDSSCVDFSKSGKTREDPSLFVKTYLILSWIVDNLDLLHRVNFCKDYYSLLLEHPEQDIAEIVRLPHKMVGDFKESLEPVLFEWPCESTSNPLKRSEEQCSAILALLGATNIPSSTTHPPGELFWITAVLLDLGLVSYVGSHGLDFGVGLKRRAAFGADIPGVFGFKCQLSRTSCLNEFLDKTKIWTFSLSTNSPRKSKSNLSILTHIEEFADLWGRTWAETVTMDSELIKWYAVCKGYIRRTQDDGNTFRGAKRCHWYYGTHGLRELWSERESEDDCLRKDDLLLIGSDFAENKNCTYSVGEFERQYRWEFGYLHTRDSKWVTDSRALGISLAKILGFQVQVTQKLFPGQYLRDALLDMWTENPDEANPSVLNNLLGVEVSHCTGNARRVTLKSVMLHESIQSRLERWVPGWRKTQWGAAFIEALCTDNSGAVVTLWEAHPEYRLPIAKQVSGVLRLLNLTGPRSGDLKFKVAFLLPNIDLSVELPISGNEWARCICDTATTAAYVILGGNCLECRAPNYPTSICGDSRDLTVLQTQVGVVGAGDMSVVKFNPYNLVLEKVDEDEQPQENMLMVIASPVKRLLSLWSKSKAAICETQLRPPPNDGTLNICVPATTKKFGGMEFPRSRNIQAEASSSPRLSHDRDQLTDPDSKEAQPGPHMSPE